VCAVLLAGLVLNDHYQFYTSWSELLGQPSVVTASSPVQVLKIDKAYRARLLSGFHRGHGTVVQITIPGPVSGVPPQPALVYLPAQYGNPAAADARYPVVELLTGIPGTPRTWTGPLQLREVLDRQIARMQSLPFIAVIPTTNVQGPRDLECVNVVNGPQVDTYLTVDVPAAIGHAVRAQPSPAGWGLMGYSTGGYCAMNLAMRHPDVYQAAVSMSGYVHPSVGRFTGPILGRSKLLFDQNSPAWLARHWHGGKLSVLAIASRHDGPSYRDTLTLANSSNGDLRITDLIVGRGGHNASLWTQLEPVAFNWLSQRMPPPLAGVVINSGLVPAPPDAATVGSGPVPRHR
jgi:enterochelin esterase-like enzyme